MIFARHLPVLVAFILAGCGSGASSYTPSRNGSGSYTPSQDISESITATSIAGKQITVESSQYLNLMPRVVGEYTSCDYLIVPAYFSSDPKPFPDGVEIDYVSLYQDSKLMWTGKISKSETRLEDGRLFAISRGCPPQDLQPGMQLEAVFKIKYQYSTFYLRAPAATLDAAY